MTSSLIGQYFMPPKGLSFDSVCEEDKEVTIMPATKLSCTLGPQSRDVQTLERLLNSGMTMARFDFSYGDVAYHQQTLDNLRQAMASTQKLCATMIDTMGPEIFLINRTPNTPIVIKAGQNIVLTSDPAQAATNEVLPLSQPLPAGCVPGSSVFVGQYLFTGAEMSSVYLSVQQVEEGRLVCKCENDCVLEGVLCTVNFADLKTTAPILTDLDKEALRTFGVANQIDFISLAFTRSEQDVITCRKFLDSVGLHAMRIMGKIENREGLDNFDKILGASDALILSRGNLGLCLEAEKMFMCQKTILRACNLAGKPVLVTRVVDTMTDAPRPTRAEATDVANLVLDGTDGILLGSETFRGRDPVGTAKTVLAICKQAEKCFNSTSFYRTVMEYMGANGPLPDMDKTEALCSSAVRAADKISAKALFVFTVTGRTARMVAKYKPSMPILAVVVPTIKQDGIRWARPGDVQARQCLSYRGVQPIMADPTMGSPGGAILEYAITVARQKGLVKTGDMVVVMQCPRKTPNDVMEEAGSIKLVAVEDEPLPMRLRSPSKLAKLADEGAEPAYLIGSTNDLTALAK